MYLNLILCSLWVIIGMGMNLVIRSLFCINYAGQPWKTQKEVRQIMEHEYHLGANGLSGNDDAGQMSAWYIFAAMGFYPVCPGSSYYILASPSFDKVTIQLEDGKSFVIKLRMLLPIMFMFSLFCSMGFHIVKIICCIQTLLQEESWSL